MEMIDGEGLVQGLSISSTGACVRESEDSPCFGAFFDIGLAKEYVILSASVYNIDFPSIYLCKDISRQGMTNTPLRPLSSSRLSNLNDFTRDLVAAESRPG